MEGLNHEAHGARCIQAECLVAHDAYLGQVLEEILGDEGNMEIVSHKDGDIFLADTGLYQFADSVDDMRQNGFLIVVVRK